MSITKELFGYTKGGQPVDQYTMTNRSGMMVQVISYAASLRALWVPDRTGRLVDVLLGYDTVAGYEEDPCFFGNLVGRFANRLRRAQFQLDGVTYQLVPNEGPNHLHGTYCNRLLEGEAEGNTLTFRFHSPDGEEGYPGNLSVCYSYTLTEDNRLLLDYWAETDKPTLVNLTNHAYFNLSGHDAGDVLDTVLQMNASQYTQADQESLLTGALCPVEGTPFDFRAPKAIGQEIGEDHPMLHDAGGYDLNMVLDHPSMVTPCATAYSPKTGISMAYFTTQPGTQFYSGNSIAPQGPRAGKGGASYGARQGFCLESQHFPCAPEFDHFPTAVLRPGQVYHQMAAYQFGVK